MTSVSRAWVAERYRLLESLGSGGMGRVWLARDEMLRRDVAIKEIVPPEGLTEEEREELRSRTMREARAAARLNNPHVVRIYDVIHSEGRPWIVMEYVPSRSLHQVITEDGPLPADRVAQIGLDVLTALKAAHSAGVLHRDVKPGNVLLADDGRVVLTDFGLAIFEGGDGAVTRPGLILGSPQYIAPERARDGISGPEADLWSLGATLYAAVEGRSPYARSTTFGTLTALATEDPDPARRAGVLKPVLTALLRKDPRARAGTAEAERLLRRAASGEGRVWPWSLPRQRKPREVISGNILNGLTSNGSNGRVLAGDESSGGLSQASPAAPVASSVEVGSVEGEKIVPLINGKPIDATSEPLASSVKFPGKAYGHARVPGPDTLAVLEDAQPVASGRQRKWLVVAAAVLVLAIVAAVLIGLSRRDGNGTTSTGPSASASPSAAATASGTEYGLPAGWHYYVDPDYHWRVAVPDGWVSRQEENVRYFDEQTYPRRVLGIYRSTTPPADPVAGLTSLEQKGITDGELPGYHRVRLEEAKNYFASAADWVYQYNAAGGRTQVCDRDFVVNDHLVHGIVWLTPAGEWTANQANWNLIIASFRPGD